MGQAASMAIDNNPEQIRTVRRRGKWTARRDARLVEMNADGHDAGAIGADEGIACSPEMVRKRLRQLSVDYRAQDELTRGLPAPRVSRTAFERLAHAARARRVSMGHLLDRLLEVGSGMIDAVLDDDMEGR